MREWRQLLHSNLDETFADPSDMPLYACGRAFFFSAETFRGTPLTAPSFSRSRVLGIQQSPRIPNDLTAGLRCSALCYGCHQAWLAPPDSSVLGVSPAFLCLRLRGRHRLPIANVDNCHVRAGCVGMPGGLSFCDSRSRLEQNSIGSPATWSSSSCCISDGSTASTSRAPTSSDPPLSPQHRHWRSQADADLFFGRAVRPDRG